MKDVPNDFNNMYNNDKNPVFLLYDAFLLSRQTKNKSRLKKKEWERANEKERNQITIYRIKINHIFRFWCYVMRKWWKDEKQQTTIAVILKRYQIKRCTWSCLSDYDNSKKWRHTEGTRSFSKPRVLWYMLHIKESCQEWARKLMLPLMLMLDATNCLFAGSFTLLYTRDLFYMKRF